MCGPSPVDAPVSNTVLPRRSSTGRRILASKFSDQASSAEAERGVNVGDQRKRVAVDPVGPPEDANDVVEEAARVRAGEEDRKPGGDDCEDDAESENEEH